MSGFFMGNMPANPVVCPSGPMDGSAVAEELKTYFYWYYQKL